VGAGANAVGGKKGVKWITSVVPRSSDAHNNLKPKMPGHFS
jgi:hypothetical protein